jgi:hypothetical protein
VTTSQQGSTAQAKPKASIIFATNNRMYQMILEHLDGSIWRTKPAGDVRTIAAIFTHVHNVRSKWVRLTAPHLKVPALLNRAHCTPTEARAGFDESAARCVEMLAEAHFSETVGPRSGRLASTCCATCWRTRLTIEGKS